MWLNAVTGEFRLEKGAEEERVTRELGDPDLPAVIKAAEPQPAAGQGLQVGRVQPVAAVVALGAPAGVGDLRGERARHDHDRLLVPLERALERDDQLLGGVRRDLGVLYAGQSADVTRELDERVLEPAARAEEGNALLASGSGGGERPVGAGVRAAGH